ncbi:hypothetical protein [Branchiibius sp. NY16-3462-2]|uniref:hypothetical protein n=1 Tax=Branchiibius sp. NY16-3462-2 TaxID=1807500 RepID=UPI000793F728|nr:hypothetical protein [Branchiibius sp. NY16-3462-2]KYH45096.1 hypothetical protein AZH51_14520 [Branchiibius sp. NY16-3462-2]
MTWVSEHRRAFVALVAAIIIALASAVVAHANDRGNPDPGGSRMAAIETAAAQFLPTTVSKVKTTTQGFRWGTGGCDGGPAGWTRGQVDVTFDGPADLPALVNSRVASVKWQAAAESSSQPAAVQDPNAVATYMPTGSNPYGEQALLSRGQHGGWDLWVTTDPAVNPDHSC